MSIERRQRGIGRSLWRHCLGLRVSTQPKDETTTTQTGFIVPHLRVSVGRWLMIMAPVRPIRDRITERKTGWRERATDRAQIRNEIG